MEPNKTYLHPYFCKILQFDNKFNRRKIKVSIKMEKSSILSKAGRDVLQSNVSLQLSELSEQKSIESKVHTKSQKQINREGSHEQITGIIETKYIDENGNYVDPEVAKIQLSEKRAMKEENVKSPIVVKKDNNSKNRFAQQAIIEQSYHKLQKHNNPYSPISQFTKNSSLLSSPHYYQPIASLFPQSLKQSPNNKNSRLLIKNYLKSMNKYETQLEQLSKMKQNHKKNLDFNSKHSYLTNFSGLHQEDFYKVDYTNSGKYINRSRLMNERLSKQSAVFFNQQIKNQLDEIQDILSDINTLNNNQQQAQYTSAAMFSKNSSTKSFNKKGGKIMTMSMFNSRMKFSQVRNIYKPSKLDTLLQQYQFTDMVPQQINHPIEKKRRQSNGFTEILVDVKAKIQKRKKDREERRKNDKFYQQVKDQIKYDVDFDSKQDTNTELNKQKSASKIVNDNNISKYSQAKQAAEKMSKIQQAEQESEVESIHDTSIKHYLKSNPDLLQLIKNFRLYQIDWESLPLIPIEQEGWLVQQWRSYPLFQSQQQTIIVQALQKASSVALYSLFSQKYHHTIFGKQQIFGLKQFSDKNNGNKGKQKTYIFMNEAQFKQHWDQVYQESEKKKQKQKQTKNKQKTSLFSKTQLSLLREFDLKWYKTIVQSIYHKSLQEINHIQKQQIKDKNQVQNDKKKDSKMTTKSVIIDVGQFIEQVKKFSPSINKEQDTSPLTVRQCIVFNKLKLIKNMFSRTNHSQHQEYSFGLISSIIQRATTENEEILIKTYLQDNFRGGIYYYNDKQKQSNICVLQLKSSQQFKINQLSNQRTKQLRINSNFVIKIVHQQTNQIKQKEKDSFVLNISMIKSQSQKRNSSNNKQSILKMNCYFNQIQYTLLEVEQTNNWPKYVFQKLKVNIQQQQQ